jgi:hypothetical protein
LALLLKCGASNRLNQLVEPCWVSGLLEESFCELGNVLKATPWHLDLLVKWLAELASCSPVRRGSDRAGH